MKLGRTLTGLAALVYAGCTSLPSAENAHCMDFSTNEELCVDDDSEDCTINYSTNPIRVEYRGVVYDIDTAELESENIQQNILTGWCLITRRYSVGDNIITLEWEGRRLRYIGLEDEHGKITLMLGRHGEPIMVSRPPTM